MAVLSSSLRVAIITGSSHGIGAAVAERLAADGLAVVINYSSGPDAAEALVAKIETAGGVASAVKADVSDPAAVAALFDAAIRTHGGVDVLVNNAGIMKLALIAQAEDALFDQHIAVNLKGTFNTLREASRRMRDGGRIVSFSSSVVGLYQPTYGIYAATKAGIEAMTHILAKEMRGRQIAGSHLRWRTGALGDRECHPLAGGLHDGDEPLRARRAARRQTAGGRVRQRADKGARRTGKEGRRKCSDR
jgi:3-oxoacyl-[acyl-carrier protein] reductase